MVEGCRCDLATAAGRAAFVAAAAAQPLDLEERVVLVPPWPRWVHAVELENRTGLASLKLTTEVRGSPPGRTVLVVRVGVAS